VSSSSADVLLVVVAALVFALVLASAAAIVGIRRPDAAIAEFVFVVITPGRAVTASAAETKLNVNSKLNVCFNNDGIPNSCSIYYFILTHFVFVGK
jgi:hypothetical protein